MNAFQSITKHIAPERESNYAKNILIGPPLRDTASEILGPKNQDLLDEFVQSFITMHDEQVIRHTQPYPDVIQVLEKTSFQKYSYGGSDQQKISSNSKTH